MSILREIPSDISEECTVTAQAFRLCIYTTCRDGHHNITLHEDSVCLAYGKPSDERPTQCLKFVIQVNPSKAQN